MSLKLFKNWVSFFKWLYEWWTQNESTWVLGKSSRSDWWYTKEFEEESEEPIEEDVFDEEPFQGTGESEGNGITEDNQGVSVSLGGSAVVNTPKETKTEANVLIGVAIIAAIVVLGIAIFFIVQKLLKWLKKQSLHSFLCL